MLSNLWNDLYHRLLRFSWVRIIAVFGAFYLFLCTGFGLLYYLLSGAVVGARPESLLDHIWFSVQTISTIGYGAMHPGTELAHILVATEAFFGVIGFALATGLVFSKFSRPTARVRFSDVATVRTRNGVRTLQLRIANERSTDIVEASVGLYLIRDEITEEGDRMRRFYPLELERSKTPVFGYSFTVMHRLDESSPLEGLTEDVVGDRMVALIVTFTGIDDAMASEVHARHSYAPEEVHFDERFVDIVDFEGEGPPGNLEIEKIDETEPVETQ